MICIFSVFVVLCNLVLFGWMLGVYYGWGLFYLLFIINIINIVFDIYFVVFFDWGVVGVVWVFLIVDYIVFVFVFMLVV